MYSEQLESLIQSIIADGEISDKERAVLHKRAETEGVDVAELDVYIEGLINQKVQSEKKYDLKLFNRVGGWLYIYRRTYKFYNHKEIDNNRGIILELLYPQTSDEELNGRLCFYVHFNHKNSKDNFPELKFLTKEYGEVLTTRVCENVNNHSTYLHIIEPENLHLLCQASKVQIHLEHYYGYYEEKGEELVFSRTEEWTLEAPLPTTFISFIQRFYRDVIDPSSFPNIEEEEAQRIEEEKNEEEEAQRIEEEERKAKEEEIKRKKVEKERLKAEERMAIRKVKDAEWKSKWESADTTGKIVMLIKRHWIITLIILYIIWRLL